jgi:hypothetical protein
MIPPSPELATSMPIQPLDYRRPDTQPPMPGARLGVIALAIALIGNAPMLFLFYRRPVHVSSIVVDEVLGVAQLVLLLGSALAGIGLFQARGRLAAIIALGLSLAGLAIAFPLIEA